MPLMKQMMTTFAALLLAVLMVFGTLPVAAEGEAGTVKAENLLAPVNPNASQEAKSLLAYLSSLKDTNTFISGAFEMSTDTDLCDQVAEQFGVKLGLYSCRYEEKVNPAYTSDNHDAVLITNEQKASAVLLEQYEEGKILLIHFDGALLTWLQDYAKAVYGTEDDMITHLDATNPNRDMHMYLAAMTYQEKLEGVLQRLEDSGVKAYLYRPFVEFTNHRINGVSDEGKEAFKRVSQQYSELMKESGLVGFLLNYTPSGGYYSGERYAGNAYYDVLGATMYSDSGNDGRLVPRRQFTDYDWMVRTGKPFGFTELSCRTGLWSVQASQGRSSWYNTLTTMLQYWPEVTYVSTWGPGSYSLLTENRAGSETAGNDDGSWFLTSPYTVNLEDLPDYRHTVLNCTGVSRVYEKANYQGDFLALEEKLYTETELKSLGFDPAKLQSFCVGMGYELLLYTGADGTGDCYHYIESVSYTGNYPAFGKIRSLQVNRVSNAALNQSEIYASDCDDEAWKANDGENSRWVGHTGADGTGWLMIDMGVPYTVNRWVVRHAEYAGEAVQYNTRDFELQYSQDGTTWKAADTVTGNTDPYTSRRLTRLVTARYFRLFITGANHVTDGVDIGRMTVAEFELYGAKAVLSASDIVPDPDEIMDDAPSDWEDGDSAEPTDGESTEEEDAPKPSAIRKVIRKVVQSGLPWWAWVLIGVGAVGGAAVVVIPVVRRRKRRPAPEDSRADS